MGRLALLFLIPFGFDARGSDRGIVHTVFARNTALLVGVANGLPGIDIDVRKVREMVTHSAYQFQPEELQSAQGTTANVAAALTRGAEGAGADGTFLFYFSGHGARGVLSMKDRLMKIGEIRSAIEKGRERIGPLQRLVMIFDSCYAGSLLDPVRHFLRLEAWREAEESRRLAEAIAREFERRERAEYWKKLFVFAACRANETSLAGSNGSRFTLAMAKAYWESLEANATMGEWVTKTQSYTKGHHPVARLVPADLENERMEP